jgi:hypothetical protein
MEPEKKKPSLLDRTSQTPECRSGTGNLKALVTLTAQTMNALTQYIFDVTDAIETPDTDNEKFHSVFKGAYPVVVAFYYKLNAALDQGKECLEITNLEAVTTVHFIHTAQKFFPAIITDFDIMGAFCELMLNLHMSLEIE